MLLRWSRSRLTPQIPVLGSSSFHDNPRDLNGLMMIRSDHQGTRLPSEATLWSCCDTLPIERKNGQLWTRFVDRCSSQLQVAVCSPSCRGFSSAFLVAAMPCTCTAFVEVVQEKTLLAKVRSRSPLPPPSQCHTLLHSLDLIHTHNQRTKQSYSFFPAETLCQSPGSVSTEELSNHSLSTCAFPALTLRCRHCSHYRQNLAGHAVSARPPNACLMHSGSALSCCALRPVPVPVSVSL